MLKIIIFAGIFSIFHKLNLLPFNEEALIGLASLLFFILVYYISKQQMSNILFSRSNNLYINIKYLLIIVKVTLRNYRKLLYIMTVLKRNRNTYFLLNNKRNWTPLSYDLIIYLIEIYWVKSLIYVYSNLTALLKNN